jgi:hypothetical protein
MPENHKQPERGFKQLACEILDISTRSYSNFSKQKRLIITLLEKYFTKEDLQEFIEFGKINKFENNNSIQKYFIERNKDEYIKNFGNNFIFIFKEEYIKDFYFYFLTSLENKKNFFSTTDYEHESYFIERYNFNKALSDYIFKNQVKEFEKRGKQNSIEAIIEYSQKQFEHIYNHLSFIQHWDNDMYFFIDFLIKTDFELFINSGDDELLYHAIGFLVYSNNNFKEEDILCDNKVSVVNKIYEYFNKNKNEINKNIIKDIVLNPEKLDELKKYKIIEKYFKQIKQETTNEEIHKIIIDSEEFEKIYKKLEKLLEKEKNDEIMNNLLNLQNEGIKI